MVLLLACSQPLPVGDPSRPDIVIVSLDTTRADVIDAETTPRLWARAATGARFTGAFAHAPTTLSSHASVFSGRDPHGHTVARNGYAIPADLPLLQERMAAAGYDTIGVVGASALARPMGLDRGFRVWNEKLAHKHEVRYESRAEQVTNRAKRELAKRVPGKPVLLFVHYFDAHAPYESPEPYATRWSDPAYTGTFDGSRRAMTGIAEQGRTGTVEPADLREMRSRYRGEVAYVDTQVDRLLAGFNGAFVVTFSDHGEALGDLPDHPFGHGPDVDPVAVHVPLVISGPGVPARTIETPVALSDVAATVLGLAGLEGGLGAGRDLAPLWRGEPWESKPVFLEATQPRKAERRPSWNNLFLERGVVRGPRMLIASPWNDQAPQVVQWSDTSYVSLDTSVVSMEQFKRETLELLQSWDSSAPPWRSETDDGAMGEALKALGYTE